MKRILFTRLSIMMIIALLFSLPILAQAQNRIIRLPEREGEDYNHLLEIIDVQVAGNPVAFDKTFFADENWLKNLKFRVKNVSGKPMMYVALGFGLFEGINQELKPYASYQYGFVFSYGKPSDSKDKVTGKVFLKPNEEVELSYDSLSELERKVLGKAGEGIFCKAEFMIARVQFKDGTFEDSDLVIRK